VVERTSQGVGLHDQAVALDVVVLIKAALWFQAITFRLEAITFRLEAVALDVVVLVKSALWFQAVTFRFQAVTFRFQAMSLDILGLILVHIRGSVLVHQ